MEGLGIIVIVLGFIFYISGRVASSDSIRRFGKGLLIAGVLLFLLFSIIDIQLQLEMGESFQP